MSYFASSASPEVAHWHAEKPTHLIQEVRQDIEKGLDIALAEARELIVEAEYSLAELANTLGIHHFGHQISSNLTGCKLVLQPHGQLEIHREGQKYPTSFPVAFITQ